MLAASFEFLKEILDWLLPTDAQKLEITQINSRKAKGRRKREREREEEMERGRGRERKGDRKKEGKEGLCTKTMRQR